MLPSPSPCQQLKSCQALENCTYPCLLTNPCLLKVPVSVEKLKALTDYTATIVNNPDGLLLNSGDSCWADFKAR